MLRAYGDLFLTGESGGKRFPRTMETDILQRHRMLALPGRTLPAGAGGA